MSKQGMTTAIFYSTVFITGAVVLILEVLAVRIMSPFFGTSMFVLSSVLTVVLTALSLGYFFGGRLADRFPDPRPLYTIIAGGGFLLLALYYLSNLFLPYSQEHLPLTYGPLVFSFLFFFLPAFLLGMDSPYVIKLLSRFGDNTDDAGKLAGTTFFWSTVGSIVGSLSAGFYFIPFVGIKTTMILAALTLAVLSLVASFLLRRNEPDSVNKPPKAFNFFVILILALATLTLALVLNKKESKMIGLYDSAELIYETDGYYGHIAILETYNYIKGERMRVLQREVNSESAVFLDSYDHVFNYTKFADLYPVLREATTTSFLMLGGGAYSIPRILEHNDPNLIIDVVELEPKLYSLARKYFDLPDSPRIENHLVDARVYLETTDRKYDVVFLDVFNSGHFIPPHLSSKEFFQLLRSRLSDDGLLIVNFIGSRDNPGQNLTDSFAMTLQSVFPNIRAFSPQLGKPTAKQNIIYLAQNNVKELDLKDASIVTNDGYNTALEDMEVGITSLAKDEQLIFTDDQAPVEYLVAKQLLFLQGQ